MNIIKWFKNKAGKIPMSVVQVAGAGAVVAVAGFGAFEYLNSPAEENNTFTPSSYGNDVVYVTSASSGSYGANGELQTAFHAAPSRAIELTERQAAAERRAQALRSSDSYYTGTQEATAPNAAGGGQGNVGYEFGATSNLGMGGDKGPEAQGGMETLGMPLSGIQDMIQNQTAAMQQAAAQGAAQGGAQGGKGAQGEQGGATLASASMAKAGKALGAASHNWGNGAAGSGSGINNEFVVQNSGKNDGPQIERGPAIPSGDFNVDGSRADDPALALNGKFSRFGDGRDMRAGKGRQGQGGAELEQMRKQSADIANNKNRAANEPGSIFQAGERLSGGMMVDSGAMPSTGAGVSSGTFNDPYAGVSKQHIQDLAKSEITEIQTQQDLYNADVSNYQKWFWGMVATCLVSMIFIPWILKISKSWGPWAWIGWVLAGIAALVSLLMIIKVMTMGSQLHQKWSENENVDYSDGWNIAGKVVGAILGLGVAASFIWHTAFRNFYEKVMNWMEKGWDWLKNLGQTKPPTGGATPPVTPPSNPPTMTV